MKKFLVLVIALVCVAAMTYAETTVLKNAEKLENVVEMRADQFIRDCGCDVCTCVSCECKECSCEKCSCCENGTCVKCSCSGDSCKDCSCVESAEVVAIRSDEERAAFEARVDALLASLGKTEVKSEEVVIEREPSPDVPLFVKKEIKQEYLQNYEEEEVVTEVKVEKKVAPKKTKKVTYGYSHK